MTTRSTRTRRQRLEERESAIITAARDVFLEKGAAGAKMTEIAHRADVAEGTLYLYFTNKQALMRAVVSDHWASLTRRTVRAVKGIEGCFPRFRALAMFHLTALIEEWPLLELGMALREASAGKEESRAFDFKRAYVATFDEIFRRGQDRGDIRADATLWMVRDLFHGTLEYSARTIGLHGRKRDIPLVVDNLMRVLEAACGNVDAGPEPDRAAALEVLTRRLEAVTDRLEKQDRARVAGKRE